MLLHIGLGCDCLSGGMDLASSKRRSRLALCASSHSAEHHLSTICSQHRGCAAHQCGIIYKVNT